VDSRACTLYVVVVVALKNPIRPHLAVLYHHIFQQTKYWRSSSNKCKVHHRVESILADSKQLLDSTMASSCSLCRAPCWDLRLIGCGCTLHAVSSSMFVASLTLIFVYFSTIIMNKQILKKQQRQTNENPIHKANAKKMTQALVAWIDFIISELFSFRCL
jgi:hypothetical protein